MKSVLISIQPKWCELIASGKKTVEIRKNRPTIRTPFKCYIYCTKKGRPLVYGSPVPSYVEENLVQTYGYSKERANKIFGIWNGKVIGEFVCDEIFPISIEYSYTNSDISLNKFPYTCLSDKEITDYLGNGKTGYGWHISDLEIYDEPKELGKFRKICKYRNDDGSCQYRKIDCDCIKYDHNPDGSVNFAECLDYMFKPPQSWCYVEELAP